MCEHDTVHKFKVIVHVWCRTPGRANVCHTCGVMVDERHQKSAIRAVTTIEDTEVMTSVFLPTKKIIIRSSIYVSVRSSCAMNEYLSACLCIVSEGH